MRRIHFSLWALLASLSILWLLADTLVPSPFNYGTCRNVFMQYSGTIAMGAMSVAMVLALRPKTLESHLGGLDKMYRLHKWLGITVLATSALHWWWGQGTKWMVQWGWIDRPARGHRQAFADLGPVEGWLRSQRGFAENLGELAFYAMLLLLVLALIKRFPYHLFQKTHKWFAVAYLVFVYHTIVLAKTEYWAQPIGWVLAVLMLLGSIAAVKTLLGKIGTDRKVQGTVESLRHYPNLLVMETRIALPAGWPGHAAGQFAFVTFDPSEGAHPYTIASVWEQSNRQISFVVKALGDHTSRLVEQLKTGARVTIEGPYGCFDFDDLSARQIWIGAGIGITPFIAAMKQRAIRPDSKPIDLFHTTTPSNRAAIDRLTADAKAAGIRLHVIESRRDGRLDAEKIRALVPDWALASIWFCGPDDFAQSLRKDFIEQGLSPACFHHELFEMR